MNPETIKLYTNVDDVKSIDLWIGKYPGINNTRLKFSIGYTSGNWLTIEYGVDTNGFSGLLYSTITRTNHNEQNDIKDWVVPDNIACRLLSLIKYEKLRDKGVCEIILETLSTETTQNTDDPTSLPYREGEPCQICGVV